MLPNVRNVRAVRFEQPQSGSDVVHPSVASSTNIFVFTGLPTSRLPSPVDGMALCAVGCLEHSVLAAASHTDAPESDRDYGTRTRQRQEGSNLEGYSKYSKSTRQKTDCHGQLIERLFRIERVPKIGNRLTGRSISQMAIFRLDSARHALQSTLDNH